ncbi:MAG TPA: arginase family protein [Bacteroidales bacterium]|nr:arginase family protein [Bacteroidales bacterium]
MLLSDYLLPVSLDKPNDEVLQNKNSFCRHIDINTANKPVDLDKKKYKLAIIGVPEYRGCGNEGVVNTPNAIRSELYQLHYFEKKIQLADLGDLKIGKELTDTFYALREIVLELHARNIVPIVIGGSQDLTYGMFLAFEYLKVPYNVATVDFKLDLAFDSYTPINYQNYLNTIILENKYLFEFFNLGHQACFSNYDGNFLLDTLSHEKVRLGNMRNQTEKLEPYLRDTHLLSIDFSAIKHADAPAQLVSSPNGLYAEDFCQCMHYAALSENIKAVGLFNIDASKDYQGLTSKLAAQGIWYFIEAFSRRNIENPSKSSSKFKKFSVTLNEDTSIVFLKSNRTGRWWFEISDKKNQKIYFACAENDYLTAINNDIPERWLKLFKKLN